MNVEDVLKIVLIGREGAFAPFAFPRGSITEVTV